MADLTAKKVSKLIEEFRQTGKEPEKLVIGYKTYARLMADDKFAGLCCTNLAYKVYSVL
ncbi:hypothetical protein F913_01949 [Acinetobacter baumannii NIPH 80]|uniref:Uncharacterized protein n=1 Tax=Acinetobacter baumannii NIPH 80 TaxID=1217629 RepID=N9L210_ACIBA|nr:hypothetical protein F913_01949 [Acinetobacter baumannii NIPH 80]